MRTRSWLCFSNLLCLVFYNNAAADNKNGWTKHNLHLGDKSIESEEVLRIVDMEEQRRRGSKSKSHEILEMDYTGTGDDNSIDLRAKAERLYKMFHINDLDDIASAVPVDTIKKYPGSTDTDYAISGLNEEESRNEEEIDEENRSSETINLINRKIDDVNNNLSEELKQLDGLQKNLNREVDLQKLLDKMIALQRKKLRSLIKVKENHASKALTLQESINKLRQLVKTTNTKKIDYLDELSNAAQLEKTKGRNLFQALEVDDVDADNSIEHIDIAESTYISDEEDES